jgi:hypothetical protein
MLKKNGTVFVLDGRKQQKQVGAASTANHSRVAYL